MPWRDVWRQRLAAHFLIDPAPGLEDVARRICGVHAQVQPAAELELGVRTNGTHTSAVNEALCDKRSLVRTYGLRGTVHIFAADEVWLWLAALEAKKPPRSPSKEHLRALPAAEMPRMLGAIADALDGDA